MAANLASNIAILTDSGIKVTYGALRKEVMKLSKKLNRYQVAIVLCQNTLGCIYCYLACLKSKVVPLLLSENVTKEQLNHYASTFNAKYICFPSAKQNTVGDSYAENEVVSVCDYVMCERKAENVKIHKDLMLLLATSGSTGNSKCVRLSRKNVVANTKSICESLDIKSTDRAITSLPMNYTYGLSVLHTHLYKGATILLTDKNVLSSDFWTFFRDERGTSFAGVPFTYECLHKLGVFRKEYKSLRVLTQAGGKLSVSLQEYYGKLAVERGFQFIIMYGQTEATARMSYLPPDEVLKRKGSVGIAIPGGRFEIVGGEIVYYGTNVFMGYANGAADLSIGDENSNVLHTGDLGYMQDGFLYVTGRNNRFAKINGVRIFLPDIEEILSQKMNQKIICLYKSKYLNLIHKRGFREKEWNEIVNWVQRNVPISASYMVDFAIEEIPQTNNGKINYSLLQTMV